MRGRVKRIVSSFDFRRVDAHHFNPARLLPSRLSFSPRPFAGEGSGVRGSRR
jgi:hypothetical protein